MVGVEIDMVVPDSLAALALFENIFGAERVEATSLRRGLNEAVLTIYGTRFHLLDENPQYELFAPKEGERKPIWMNVAVEDIGTTYARALAAGCVEIQPVTEVEGYGAKNAMFADPFGYVWMLHQILRSVSFEDRIKMAENL